MGKPLVMGGEKAFHFDEKDFADLDLNTVGGRATAVRRIIKGLGYDENTDAKLQSHLIHAYVKLANSGIIDTKMRKLSNEESELFRSGGYKAVVLAPALTDYVSLLRCMYMASHATIGTDNSYRVVIGPWFFDPSLGATERGSLIIHEVMHGILGHYDLDRLDPELSNIAGDAVINQQIERSKGMRLPVNRDRTTSLVFPRTIITKNFPKGMENNLAFPKYYGALLEERQRKEKEDTARKMAANSGKPSDSDSEKDKGSKGNPQNENGQQRNGGQRSQQSDQGQQQDGNQKGGQQGQSGQQGGQGQQSQQDGNQQGQPCQQGGQGQSQQNGGGQGQSQQSGQGQAGGGQPGQGGGSGQGGEGDANGGGSASGQGNGSGDGDNGMRLPHSVMDHEDGTSSDMDGNPASGGAVGSDGNPGECNPVSDAEGHELDENGVQKAGALEKEMARAGAETKAMAQAKGRGNSGSDFNDFILDSLRPPKVKWETLLHGIVARSFNSIITGHTDYSYRHPNRRYRPNGAVFPGSIAYAPRGLVGCDTSGSMGEDDYRNALSEVEGLLKSFVNGGELSFVTVDTAITGMQTVNTAKGIDLRGGGGTCMEVFYRFVNSMPKGKKPDYTVLMTDAYIDWEESVAAMDKNIHNIILVTEEGGMECAKEYMTGIRNLTVLPIF